MNILIAGTDFPPNWGGISTYTTQLASSLAKKCSVIVLSPGPGIPEFDDSQPYRIVRTPAIPFFRLCCFLLFVPWAIREFKVNVVLHTVWTTSLVSHLWHKLMPVPYFVAIHGSEILDDHHSWRRRLKRLLGSWRKLALRKAGGVFPVSQYSAKLAECEGVNKERIKVIPNGVDPVRFFPRYGSSIQDHVGTLLTVARLDLHKGHDHVLQALAILKRNGLEARYIIAGEGDEKERLCNMTTELGLEEQVTFKGFVSDLELPLLYQKADVFIMASREVPGRVDMIEGFGLSYLEASASGLPVIGGRSGGTSDAIRDGVTGFLVDPNDIFEIERAIRRLLTDKDLCSRMGEEGRRWTEAEMNWDEVSEKMLAHMSAFHQVANS